MMIFLQQTAVRLFLICNIQFFPVFIDYSEGIIEWGEQTVTLWTVIEFYVFMHVFI